MNPLKFYRENKTSCPHLANLSRMLFSIPASYVLSDFLFSKAGLLLFEIN